MGRLKGHALKPRILYERLPPNHSHVFPGRMRGPGYDRQQWSFFYSDRHVPVNPTDSARSVVMFFDSDVAFITPVLHEDLFEGTRPRLIGLGWDSAPYAEFLNGTTFAVNLTPPGHFMTNFPVAIKDAHFAAFRTHVEAVHQMPFDLAFARIVRAEAVLYNKVRHPSLLPPPSPAPPVSVTFLPHSCVRASSVPPD